MDSTLIRISHPFKLKPSILANTHYHKPHSLKLFKLRNSSKRTQNDAVFDEAAYEAERLRLDAKARQSMAETSKREIIESAIEDDPKAWKWVIRKRIWDMMEAQNFAQNPRPVHHRIPNFVGASTAADKVKSNTTQHNIYIYIYTYLCIMHVGFGSLVDWKCLRLQSV